MARRKQRGALRPTAPMMANACSPRPGRLSPGAPARPRDSPAEPGRRSEAADTDCVSRAAGPYVASRNHRRSEEHTSELQSLMRISYAVFCLKKKKTQCNKTTQPTTIKPHHNRK